MSLVPAMCLILGLFAVYHESMRSLRSISYTHMCTSMHRADCACRKSEQQPREPGPTSAGSACTSTCIQVQGSCLAPDRQTVGASGQQGLGARLGQAGGGAFEHFPKDGARESTGRYCTRRKKQNNNYPLLFAEALTLTHSTALGPSAHDSDPDL